MTYEEFINNILETRGRFACGDEYHERHHIVPKCMGGGNEKENLIDLYAREHFEAHRLLALENPENDGLVYAWQMMAFAKSTGQERYELTATEYEELKKKISETRIGKYAGENNPMYGKKRTDEERKKMSESLKGKYIGEKSPTYKRKHTDEEIKKMRENHKDYSGENHPNYGKHFNEETRTKISRSLKGKYIKEKSAWYGKHLSEETKIKLSKSLKGKMAGENHPNYGKKLSEETKNKIKASLKGKMSGENNPNYGKHLSNETKQKISKKNSKYVICIECGIIFKSLVTASKFAHVSNITISACCRGRLKTAGGYQWKYLYDQTQKDGTVIPGAITLGLITEEEALRMLEEQKDTEGEI